MDRPVYISSLVVLIGIISGVSLGSWFGGGSPPRLRLQWSLGAFADRRTGDISPLYVFFDVHNAGETGAEVVHLCVELEGGRRLDLAGDLDGDHRPPSVLAPGETVRFHVRAKTLAARIRDEGHTGRPRVRLIAEDGLGRDHAKRFRFRVDEYLLLKDEG